MSTWEFIDEVNLCSAFIFKETKENWKFAASHLYAPGVRLFEQGNRPEEVYRILSRLVKLTVLDAHGREL